MKKNLLLASIIFLTIFLSLNLITPLPIKAQNCTNVSEARTSWPDADPPKSCPGCNQTSYQTAGCAQSFDANYIIKKIPSNSECLACKDGKTYAKVPWKASITINPIGATVPFAGKKEEENEILYLADYFEGTHEYYRDYPVITFPFDIHGVNPILIFNSAGPIRKLTPQEYQDDIKKLMVERTIASKQGAENGRIRDYRLKYLQRLCWNLPLTGDIVSVFIENTLKKTLHLDLPLWKYSNYCLYALSTDEAARLSIVELALKGLKSKFPEIEKWYTYETAEPSLVGEKLCNLPGVNCNLSQLKDHYPPDPSDNNYLEKYDEWKSESGKKWWKLWQTVPLVTREDTNGTITIQPEFINGVDAWSGETSTNIRVPHLARLWESSRLVQKILLPLSPNLSRTSDKDLYATNNQLPANTALQNQSPNTGNLLANANCGSPTTPNTQAQVLGEKTLIAQGGCNCSISLQIAPDGPAVPGVHSFQVLGNGNVPGGPDKGDICDTQMFVSYQPGGTCPMNYPRICPPTTCFEECTWNLNNTPCPPPQSINMNYGDSFTASVNIYESQHVGVCSDCKSYSASCTITLARDGWQTTCGAPPPVEPPCPPEIPKSDYCIKPALTDSNPNDQICGEPLSGSFVAYDYIQAACQNCSDVSESCCNGNYNICCPQDEEDGVCYQQSFSNPTTPECEACINRVDTCCAETQTNISVSRQFEVSTNLPYLSEIWSQTASTDQGFFNIFRPAEYLPFEDKPAKSGITYSISDCSNCSVSFPGGAGQSSIQGDFYYPYLGGVQMSKEQTVRSLTPYVD